jgi:hypothetical protein
MGDQWHDAIYPLRVICLVVPLRMLNAIFSTSTIGLGPRGRRPAQLLVNIVVLPAAFFFGVHWGVNGLATRGRLRSRRFVIVFPRISQALGITLREIADSVWAPLVSGAAMWAAIIGMRTLTLDLHDAARLTPARRHRRHRVPCGGAHDRPADTSRDPAPRDRILTLPGQPTAARLRTQEEWPWPDTEIPCRRCPASLFLTDGGIETTLIFHDGLTLRDFAAFELLNTAEGEAALRKYFASYADIARRNGTGVHPRDGHLARESRLGEASRLHAGGARGLQSQGVALLESIRREYGSERIACRHQRMRRTAPATATSRARR